jgi:hypothetical protein
VTRRVGEEIRVLTPGTHMTVLEREEGRRLSAGPQSSAREAKK